ncbi:metallophosphoesterase family protein [Alkalibaculum bacchi]|uniref:metallophosphoesterase family protein n=2 Tax=Alkalibaculum bacchi TaxID=645887 RepID=UPI0026EFC488|nr:metallophosphoesterase family protein [Alkalibaculum bacchi]
MKVGVISDTHIPKKTKELPKFVLDTFQGIDSIIHAGDIMTIDVIYQLNEIAPVTAVAGNNDSVHLHEILGSKKILDIGNFRIGITHGHGQSGKTIDRVIKCFQEDEVNCIIFGHSHMPLSQVYKDILLFNPGSPTDKRRNKNYSFGILEIHESIHPHIVYF